MAKLKLGIAKLNTADLIFYCNGIESSMSSNAHFPNPAPTLAEITAKREELEELDIKSSDGDRIAIYNRNTVADELKNMLRKLSLYVSFVADGDGNIILSSGFDIRKEPSPIATISRPAALKAQRSDHIGRVKLKWAPVKNAAYCRIEMTTTDPADEKAKWVIAESTTKSKVYIEDLIPGQYYWFRVKAFARLHESGYSDPAVIM
ncbi:MAG: fibronectin type III domain-containing protein, partial [Cryomorphaceae bacterium]